MQMRGCGTLGRLPLHPNQIIPGFPETVTREGVSDGSVVPGVNVGFHLGKITSVIKIPDVVPFGHFLGPDAEKNFLP